MRAGRRLFVATTGLMLASTVAIAKPPATKPTGGTKAHASGPNTHASKPSTKPTSHGASAKSANGTTKSKTAKSNAPSTAVTSPSTTASNTNDSGAAPTNPSSASWTPNNPISQKLSTKTDLMNRVKTTLPAGTDLNGATAGFKNFGQFIAATNATRNLGIDFGKLKAAMTGTTLAGSSTGQPTVSLGQAIQQLKPGVNATAEASRAESQANAQIAETGGL